jgi:hypothetical protein
MTQATQNATATEVTTVAAVAAAPKAPSKKSLALAIFAAALTARTAAAAAGTPMSNKDFRAGILKSIQADLGVSVASAATMYNAAKKEAEAADATVALGRDPKKVKVKVSTGKRGRPVGSKNKAKAEVAPVAPAAEVAPEAGLVLPEVQPEVQPADATA